MFSRAASAEDKFSVSAPQTVLSNERLKETNIGGIDASLYALNDNGQWKWFCTSRWKFVYSLGTRNSPLDNVVLNAGLIEGLPEPYSDTKLGFASDHRWGNISWIANVYRHPENGHILGFVHVEYAPPTRSGVYFRLGLAISKDGGRSFQWCGFIIEPELSYATWSQHWYPDKLFAGFIYPNTGLANYVVKDGWFHLYYTDTKDKPDALMNGTAVVRARVADVLAAAEKLQASPWKKYFDGAWNESGRGGRFTPLNIAPLGFLHGDAAYNSYLDKYVLVTRKYFYVDGHGKVFGSDWKHVKTDAILLSFSKDGIHWSEWRVVHEDAHPHDYPSIISLGADNEMTGKSFWVYYKYFYDSTLPDIAWGRHRWDRVLVTLE
ncbi:MAG: hypothetical protein NTV49_04755 [Kiritimatiellaeota bacterium]|nr:hypothetical protein [Kiritimatiellota bacterium]